MRILVTGTSGHIGGAIAGALSKNGHEVIGVSRSPNDALPPNIKQYSLDIADDDFVEQILNQVLACDAVIHAAACIDASAGGPEIVRTNGVGTAQVLEMAKQGGARCCIYLSSLSILGYPCQHPVTEEHPLNPQTVYAASKLLGEQLISMADSTLLRTVALRVSSPVGPGLRHRKIVRLFVERAIENKPLLINGKGARRQDYVDVRDIAHAVQQALQSNCHGIFNIGTGQSVSNMALAERCIKTLHSSSSIVATGKEDPDDDLCWDLSVLKAERQFGYRPQFTLEKSILDLAAEIQ